MPRGKHLATVLSNRRSHLRGVSRRRGVAVVELAIVAPVLITLAIGCYDFGRIFHVHQVVTNASRCGVDYAATHKPASDERSVWEAEIRNRVDREMQNCRGYDASLIDVAIEVVDEADELYRVGVGVTYRFDTIVHWPGIPNQVGIGSRVEMRRIR